MLSGRPAQRVTGTRCPLSRPGPAFFDSTTITTTTISIPSYLSVGLVVVVVVVVPASSRQAGKGERETNEQAGSAHLAGREMSTAR